MEQNVIQLFLMTLLVIAALGILWYIYNDDEYI